MWRVARDHRRAHAYAPVPHESGGRRRTADRHGQ
ncbi:MAG TPA: hypothetical protein DCP73_11510, partial [Chloroflexi bacterium]|nr:hypothetical protein [Chloroflexota bacterium]